MEIEKNLFQKILIANCRRFPIKQISISVQQPFIKKADIMLYLIQELQETSQKFQRTIQRKFNLEELLGKLQNWYLLTYAYFIKELAKKKVKLYLSEETEWESYFLQQAKLALAIKVDIAKTNQKIDQRVH